MKPLLLILAVFIIFSFGYDHTDPSKITSGNSVEDFDKPVINVSTVNELYDEVNKVSNSGAIIQLQPGLYKLSTHVVFGNNRIEARPNKGRLELQRDMELRGILGEIVQGDFSPGSIIDGSGLPNESYQLDPASGEPSRTGFIRMGNGKNKLSWLEIRGHQNDLNAVPFAAIDTYINLRGVLTSSGNYIPPDKNVNRSIHIEYTIIEGAQIGISIRNSGISNRGYYLQATINNNKIRSNKAGAGAGIAIQNSAGADNASIFVTSNKNNSRNNKTGIRISNDETNNSTVTVYSENDKFDYNEGNGILLYGARILTGSNSVFSMNRVAFYGHNTSLTYDNRNQPAEHAEKGSIYAVGGYTSGANGNTNQNFVQMILWKPVIANNNNDDVHARGVNSKVSFCAGKENNVSIMIQAKTVSPYRTRTSFCQPDENIVRVEGLK